MAYNGMLFATQQFADGNKQRQSEANTPSCTEPRNGLRNQSQLWYQRPIQNSQQDYPAEHQRSLQPRQAYSAVWNSNQQQYFNGTTRNSQHLVPLKSIGNLPANQHTQHSLYKVHGVNSVGRSDRRSSYNICQTPISYPNAFLPDTTGMLSSRQPSCGREGNPNMQNILQPTMQPNNYQVRPNVDQGERTGFFAFSPSPFPSQSNAPQNWQIFQSQPIISSQETSQPKNKTQLLSLRQINQQPPSASIQYGDQPKITVISGIGNDWVLECEGVKVQIKNRLLWSNFDNVITEMILSKDGRRMFPTLNYELIGLDPSRRYAVYVDFVLASGEIWKYDNQSWTSKGSAINEGSNYHRKHRIYFHPDSTAYGKVWLKNGADFSKLKVSNHIHKQWEKTLSQVITLSSMQTYQPRLHVIELYPLNRSIGLSRRTFVFPKTAFITVTLYQDTDVSDLKVNLNPFAKSSRNKSLSSESSKRRKSSASSSTSNGISSIPSDGNSDALSYKEEKLNKTACVPLSDIVKIENPVDQTELENARSAPKFKSETSIMSPLVEASNEPENNSKKKRNGNNSHEKFTNLDTNNHYHVSNDENSNDASNFDVDFELDIITELIEEIGDDVENWLLSDTKSLKPPTIHHYPQSDCGVKEKKKKFIKSERSSERVLADYQLLNIDRCYPTNEVAPLNKTFPFKSNDLIRMQAGKNKLPVFYKCNLYRAQAAAAAQSNQKGLAMKHSPVLYLPTKTDNNSNISGYLAAPVNKTAQCSFKEIPNLSPLNSLPTFSDGCISLDDISACSMTSVKRKFDEDDDGFPNLSELKSFYDQFPPTSGETEDFISGMF
ncbi:uncharacterized protein LOC143452213 isoform X3 [Clavelina lepadiformis]|uniref:uncharacterized protein LOC143452213 isoform X3 n=1 Tax=Clavelina lepadiformis TaxID=159417 RepID=UPI004042FBE8